MFKIPTPEFYVVYTGATRLGEDEHAMKLSDAFIRPQALNYLELIVPVFSQQNAFGVVGEFIRLIDNVKESFKQTRDWLASVKQAVAALKQCGGFLADIIEKESDLMLEMAEYMTKEDFDNIEKENAREEGRKDGLNEGRNEMQGKINSLNIHLIRENRIDDLQRAATDVEYQAQLLRELFPQETN